MNQTGNNKPHSPGGKSAKKGPKRFSGTEEARKAKWAGSGRNGES